MKTKIKIIMFAIFILVIMGFTSKVEAASASISATKTTATVGDSVTIKVNINAAAWNLQVSGNGVSGGSIVGYDSEGSNTSTTKTYTLSTSTAGSYTIYLTGDVTDGNTDENSSISKSVTVKVNAKQATSSTNNSSSSSGSSSNNTSSSSSANTSSNKSTTTTKPSSQTTTKEEEKSKDSSLATLAVAEGVLTPEFNKDVKEYTLTVPNEVTTINVAATTSDKKASYVVAGNTELKEGENIVTITVKAEDGSTTDYVVKVTRARPALSLKSLIIKYTNQNGELIELPLTPTFSFDVYDYKIEELEYWIEKLDIEAVANIEGATIEIQGNEDLKTGENIITIIVKLPITIEGEIATVEDVKESEEIVTYTIKFNKNEEPVPPTLMGRISDWFNGMLAGISAWYMQNQAQVIMGALSLCIVALIGLSIYIVVDYKKYKVLLDKLKKVNEINNSQTVENVETQNISEIESNDNKDNKPKGGKHF